MPTPLDEISSTRSGRRAELRRPRHRGWADQIADAAAMRLVAEVPLRMVEGSVALATVGQGIVGQPQHGRRHLLGRGVDGAFLEQGLEVRRQQHRQAAGHGLGDGAAERLHPARMMVVDEEVEAAQELLGRLAAKLDHLPIRWIEADQVLQESTTAEDAHLDARMLGVDLEHGLARVRPLSRVGPAVTTDHDPLGPRCVAHGAPALDLDHIVPVIAGKARPAGEACQLLADQRPHRRPDRRAAQDLLGIAADLGQVVVGLAVGLGRRVLHDDHPLVGAQPNALPRQQHGGVGIVQLCQACLDRLARGHYAAGAIFDQGSQPRVQRQGSGEVCGLQGDQTDAVAGAVRRPDLLRHRRRGAAGEAEVAQQHDVEAVHDLSPPGHPCSCGAPKAGSAQGIGHEHAQRSVRSGGDRQSRSSPRPHVDGRQLS